MGLGVDITAVFRNRKDRTGGRLSRGQTRKLDDSYNKVDFGSKSGNEPSEVVNSSLL